MRSRFRWMKVKVGFMVYSFPQDGNREAVTTTRQCGFLKVAEAGFLKVRNLHFKEGKL